MSSSIEKADKVRVTADLPLSTIETLRNLAASRNITLTEALKQAIQTEGALHDRVDDDTRVLLQSKDGTRTTELLFRK